MTTKTSKPPKRRFAAYRGEFEVPATFFEPLPEAELAPAEGKGYDADPLRQANVGVVGGTRSEPVAKRERRDQPRKR